MSDSPYSAAPLLMWECNGVRYTFRLDGPMPDFQTAAVGAIFRAHVRAVADLYTPEAS